MPPKLDIGVLTLHRCINYGSYWQARCLVEGLRGLGHEAVLLDHDCPRVKRAEWRCALNPLLPQSVARSERRKYAEKARRFFAAQDRLPRSPAFPLHEPGRAGRRDAVVVGSDEVWNSLHPWYGGRPIFFGKDLDAARLVSYAASFGTHRETSGLEPVWAGLLARFSAISVRDSNSQSIISRALAREAALVLDPCLQFPPAAKPAAGDAPYAVVYGHGFPEWFGRRVRRWADRRGVRLLSIGYGNAFAHEQLIEAGPEEFAGLMAGARAVATNFFHGCVFALLNRKPFLCVGSWYRFNKISGLMQTLDALEHVASEAMAAEAFEPMLDRPPRPAVTERLAALRRSSRDYIDHALG